MPRDRGQTYQLEHLPPGLMRHVKARAALEGQTVRAVVLAVLQEYATGTLTPKQELVVRSPAQRPTTSHVGDPITASAEPPSPMPGLSAPDPDLGF